MAKTSKDASSHAYGYVRVSTDEQVDEGLSLRAQRAKIRTYAKLHNLKLIKIYADEGISGSTLDERPQLNILLDAVKTKPDETIIVYRLSRLSRRTRDLLFLVEDAFVKGNTRLVSITETIDTNTPMGRFFLTIMAALAQMERELIAQRTKDALKFKKEQGDRLGAAPYGFRWTKKGKLQRVAKEMKIVKQIFKWRQQKVSYTKIAQRLNDKKIPTRRGKQWHASTVRYIATNKRYRIH